MINNITDLRKTLCTTLIDLRAKRIDPATATEINNSAGKIIQSAKLELEYSGARRTFPSMGEISFMESKNASIKE